MDLMEKSREKDVAALSVAINIKHKPEVEDLDAADEPSSLYQRLNVRCLKITAALISFSTSSKLYVGMTRNVERTSRSYQATAGSIFGRIAVMDLVFIYLIIKLLCMFVIRLKRDILLWNTSPLVKPGGNRTDNGCALVSDLYWPEEAKIQQLSGWLEIFGDLLIAEPGSSDISYAVMALTYATFILPLRFSANYAAELTVPLKFIATPMEMKRQFCRKLEPLVRRSFNELYDVEQKTTRSVQLKPRDQRLLVKLVDRIVRRNLVEPANLSLAWHSELTLLWLVAFLCLAILVFSGIITVNSSLLISELLFRQKQLGLLHRCKEWNHNATHLRLKLGQPTLMDGNYEAGLVSVLRLEPNFILEFALADGYIFFGIFFVWFSMLFVIAHNLTWFRQVERQLETALDQLFVLLGESGKGPMRLPDSARELDFLYSSFKAYANYRALQRDFPPQRAAIRMALLSYSGLIATTMTLVYYMTGAINGRLGYMLTFSSPMGIFCINVGLAMAARLSKSAERIMRLMARLAGQRQQQDLSDRVRYSLELWRRQVLDPQALYDFFSINFLGITIDPNKVLTLNYYMAFVVANQISHEFSDKTANN